MSAVKSGTQHWLSWYWYFINSVHQLDKSLDIYLHM